MEVEVDDGKEPIPTSSHNPLAATTPGKIQKIKTPPPPHEKEHDTLQCMSRSQGVLHGTRFSPNSTTLVPSPRSPPLPQPKYIRGLMCFIVSLGALINNTKFQTDSLTPSWSKSTNKFTTGITIGNKPKNRISLKQTFLMVLVQI